MISIIILSYNTKQLLHACISSILAHLPQTAYEIIVVDNDSKDASVAMIKHDFKQVRLIENKENGGFAKGINIGVTKAKGEYLLFLNSDAELMDDNLLRLLAHFEQKKVGVVGGLLSNANGSAQRSSGKFYTLAQVFLTLLLGDKGEQLMQSHSIQETDWVSGGFMLMRKELFEELGGFDENFFMYVEDMELCYRVKLKKYTVLINPTVRVLHVGHGSSNRTFAIVNIYKGVLYFSQKHRSLFSYIIVRGLLLSKAYIAIGVGRLTHNTYLTKTYREAVQCIV
ncbi:N/A [soil metagenome]